MLEKKYTVVLQGSTSNNLSFIHGKLLFQLNRAAMLVREEVYCGIYSSAMHSRDQFMLLFCGTSAISVLHFAT